MSKAVKRISIKDDFSQTPAGRYRHQGDYSGEAFREDVLLPAFKDHHVLIVNVDDTDGYGSSFLEEAFGGLIRKGYFTHSELKERLNLESKKIGFGHYIKLINKYIKEAKLERNGK